MKSLLTATAVLVALGLTAWALALFSTSPLPVTLSIGSLQLQTSLPVAAVVGLIVLVLAFYAGRLAGWLLRLPRTLLHIRRRKAGQQLAQAYAALFLHNTAAAMPHLEGFHPDTETHALLADLLHLAAHLQAHTMPPKLEHHLANPISAPLAAWAAARHAATQTDWPEVARLTALGREHAPRHLPLLVLQFKALVNLGDPQATTLLPALKPHLSTPSFRLLTELLQGPTALTARPVLDNPWVTTFQAWLPTPSEDLPDEPHA